MTRMTIATDRTGNVIGAFQHVDGRKGEDMECGVSFAAGHSLHEIEVGKDLDMERMGDADAFYRALQDHVKKNGLKGSQSASSARQARGSCGSRYH